MIIVTGGAGFIGSNIVKELNRKGRNDILIVDDLKNGENYKNLRGLHFIDYRHYEYSKTLLHFCLLHRVPFLYASSASTYGAGRHGFTENDAAEDALNPYAYSKLAFDRYVRQVMRESRSQIVGLRYFNVFGPQEQHKGKMASIFYQLYRQLKETGEARLFRGTDGFDDGEQRRDFIYVKDVVKVNFWFWENKGPSGIYNCGTGKAHTYNEAADAVIAALGKGYIGYRDFPEVLKGKYQSFTEADPKQLLKTGYDGGFHDFRAAVKEYVDFLEDGGYFCYAE